MTAPQTPAPGPLAGIRVADFSRVLAGPYATMILAELGADVVKVEHPGHGDDTRAWGPPYAGGEAAYYLALNRGKRSIALDVKHPSGGEIARRLCAGADVVIENFRPGVAERLGLGYETVRGGNPDVVYCSISGFPGEDRPGFDATIQAESGYMHITGESPSKVGVAITDVLAGLNAAVAILGALHRRASGGPGGRVEVSLLGSALSGLVNVAQSALISGEEAVAYGNAHPAVVPYQTFHAADGRFVVAAGNDRLFRALCGAIGRDDLAADPRFSTNAGRVRHREALIAELEAVFATRGAEEWTTLLDAAGVPTGKIRGVLEALRAAPGSTFQVEHPTAGPLDLVRTGFTVGDARHDAVPPPLLGQHTFDLLAELGVGDEDAARLAHEGVVRQAPAPSAR
ncbi:CoA transferase [Sphaerisporangium siamense]|uniref:CoA:oxalate CoA-transferase n=1 Tax=Sphaerisporangium siamense TaxID=795645 RepID=A0A7W7D3I8_9ACTN|nr:CoA transferase [Sphaerisporangium siamense]MBB4699522.1 CoA:oxalate CoA-transferase [Sphaerisporangium siamense]GII86936.1 CoA transferase [Sphaerisporangium siamense]